MKRLMKSINRAPGGAQRLQGGVMKRFFVCGEERRTYLARMVILSALFGALCAGCTRLELEDKASAYNAAIGESNNRQILLNAVRASQRAPMSFVGFGEMAATPTFSGGATGMWNFDPFGLVTSSSLGTTVNAGGGFTGFQLSNLNNQDFIKAVQKPLTEDLIRHFEELGYPVELRILVFVQKIDLTRSEYSKIVHDVAIKCTSPLDRRSIEFCEQIEKDKAAAAAGQCPPIESDPTITVQNTITIPNSGREFCPMNRFQTLVRQLTLLNRKPRFKLRTAEGMLYWLGQLIAAQNYAVHPYLPEIFIETPDGHWRAVPLFVVRRGPPLLPPAVVVIYHGEIYYIPQPELGTIEEARSLQVLDLVWWAMVSATTKGDLPKSSTVTLVTAR